GSPPGSFRPEMTSSVALAPTRPAPRSAPSERRARPAPPLRVLVVSPLYHPDRGGLGRQAVLLTERLAELGVSLEVVTRRMRGLPPHTFSPLVKIHQVPAPRPRVHNYEEPNLENFLTSLAF